MAAPVVGVPRPAPQLLLDIPAWVLEQFCRTMDCLSDNSWMLFASHVISDQMELRRIKSMEKTGVSITRELMWWWGQRSTTVVELLVLLQKLELYRARDVILNWYKGSCFEAIPGQVLPDEPKYCKALDNAAKTNHSPEENAPGIAISPDSTEPERMLALCLPNPPSPPESLMRSLRSSCDADLVSPGLANSVSSPQQETNPVLPGCNLLWTKEDVKSATNGFSEGNKISSGSFADVFRGQKGQQDYAIKKLNEHSQCSRQTCMQMFFHAEVQICSRCSHENILKLQGWCLDDGFLCLIYQHMFNGSLDKVLDPRHGKEPLTWDKRVTISLGLLRAVRHLHNVGILHGNIKSSNVLLDENFTPKLGHSGVRFDHKADFTRVATKMLSACQAYLPEEYIRSGQFTAGVDIFSCGIVLAELLTDKKAMEEGKSSVYLKDLMLAEIQRVRERLRAERKSVDEADCGRLPAKEIVAKYFQRNAGHLPEEAAVIYATAICQCLRKKKADLSKIYALMEKVELKRQHPHLPKVNNIPVQRINFLSANYPEETDEDSMLSNESVYGGPSLKINGVSSPQFQQPEKACTRVSRTPCESDESDFFSNCPASRSRDGGEAALPDSSTFPKSHVEATGVCKMERCGGVAEDQKYSCPLPSASFALEESQSLSSTTHLEERGASKPETSKKSNAKEKLLQKIALYEEGQIDSSELLSLNAETSTHEASDTAL
ncbi:interleukin-1 receptor-associated kinase-like 2 isoform X1 [Lissotriton helveticus]